MCGVAAWLGRPGRAVPEGSLEAMISSARHRGPDGDGFYRFQNVGLGHARLAILDLSSEGAQPFIDDELVLTYNGEIYNYLEIRSELEALGHSFRSRTDTEVLIKAYRQWGEACLSRFNGMFAFLIWDSRQRAVFAARDRFGVKPLYYRITDEALLFGSEIRQILAVSDRPPLHEEVVADYLGATLVDHREETFFRGIQRVPPGAWMRWSADLGTFKMGRWYELKREVRPFMVEELQVLMLDSLKLRQRSDVRVGTCLSGGIDSSTLAWWAGTQARERGDRPFFGITASSLDPQNDETAHARRVAEAASLDWHCVRPSEGDFEATLEELIRVQEEPFTGPSLFMQFFVMKKAREQGCVVLLDGQGGDEVFMGYPKYAQPLLRGVRREKGLWSALLRAQDLGDHAMISGADVVRLVLKGQLTRLGFTGPYEAEKLLAPSLRESVARTILTYRQGLESPDEAQIQDLTRTNLPQLLRYEDKNSMHHSIEARLPFLDYRVVEYGVGLSMDDKCKDGWLKSPVRRWMDGRLPPDILWRKDKIGFAAPENHWSRQYQDLLRQERSQIEGLREWLPGLRLDSVSTMSRSMQWKLINLAIWSRIDLNVPTQV